MKLNYCISKEGFRRIAKSVDKKQTKKTALEKDTQYKMVEKDSMGIVYRVTVVTWTGEVNGRDYVCLDESGNLTYATKSELRPMSYEENSAPPALEETHTDAYDSYEY